MAITLQQQIDHAKTMIEGCDRQLDSLNEQADNLADMIATWMMEKEFWSQTKKELQRQKGAD